MKAQALRANPPALATSKGTVELHRTRAVSLPDVAVAVLFALLAGVVIWNVQRSMDARFFVAPAGNDVWFEADLPTVADTVLHRWSVQSRNARHPLFPLLATGSAYALRAAGLAEIDSRVVVGACRRRMGWPLLHDRPSDDIPPARRDRVHPARLLDIERHVLFRRSRNLHARVRDAARAARADRRRRRGTHARELVRGCLGRVVQRHLHELDVRPLGRGSRWPWRRALQISINAVFVVGVIWAVQRVIFPTAPFFFGYSNEERFVLPAAGGGPGPIARALFFHTIVMPHIELIPEPKWGTVMSVQHSPIASSGAWGVAATVAWAGLLASTIGGLMALRGNPRVRIVVLGTLAGQVLFTCCTVKNVPVCHSRGAIARADDDGGGFVDTVAPRHPRAGRGTRIHSGRQQPVAARDGPRILLPDIRG